MLQEGGLVGCGGAGFPTYVKYIRTPSTLVVNAAESEPGYYADKLLLRDEPEALVDVLEWMEETFRIDRFVIAAEDVAKPYMQQLERIAADSGLFEVRYIPSVYRFGQEKALCKQLFGTRFEKGEIPPDQDIVVNNVETLFHMFRAMFEERPMITKFLHCYGEGFERVRAVEVPIGARASDVLTKCGLEWDHWANCDLYNGGPILSKKVSEGLAGAERVIVEGCTNAFLVADPAKIPRNRYYPSPDYEANHADAPWAPNRIDDLTDAFDVVRVPLKGAFWSTGSVLVKAGDEVDRGDALANPEFEGFSIGVHASIDGIVHSVSDGFVEIRRER